MIILYISILILSVIGLAEVIHAVKVLMLRMRNRSSLLLCCVLKGKFADIDLQYAVEQFRWYGKECSDGLVAVNLLEDTETLERCLKIAERYSVRILAPDETSYILKMEN